MISVILPTYNNSQNIIDNIMEVRDFLEHSAILNPYEIIVVNDCSRDSTKDRLRELGGIKVVNLTENCGKGFALKTGCLVSQGDVIVFLDSDLDISPSYIFYLFWELKSNERDGVIGTKYTQELKNTYPLFRMILSQGYRYLIRLLFQLPYADTQTGIKIFKREVLFDCAANSRVDRFSFDVEILHTAYHLGYKIMEYPITLNGLHKDSTIKFKDILRTFWETIKLWKNSL